MTSIELVHYEMLANAGAQGRKSDAIRQLVLEVRKLQRRRDAALGPTLPEVLAYAEQIKMSKPEEFFDHFQTTGWRYGRFRVPIRDFKAAMRQWQRRSVASDKNKRDHGVK